ncbi:MAG: glycosyltransferase [Clostridia bacterium]|nr:glycosyltransferase [Clostridia bacterium]
MKIGLFTDTFYPEINGVATSCLSLERELTRRGHEVHVFAPKCKGWKEHERDNIHYIASAPLLVLRDRNFAFPTPLTKWDAVKLDFDVVHTNSEFVMGMFGHHVARANDAALVHTYHTVWEDYTYYVTHGVADKTARKITRKYSQWWCDRFERVIVPTGKTEDLLRRYGVKAPIDVIPSGMDIARFAPALHSSADIARVREECGVRPGERVLINIGRLAKEKNIERAMRVFPALHERCPDVRFVIVGEGPQREHLAQMAQELGVADAVSVVGPRPWERIDDYYAMGDVFVSASRSETQGLTYVEAMASGLCVCAVNDQCLDGVIEDGVSGVLTEDTDEALLAGLIRAFSEEGARIAAGAPGYAQPFSTEAFAEKVEACYIRAVEDNAAGK